MKNKKLMIIAGILVLLGAYQVKAETAIKNPTQAIFSINNKTYTNQDVYQSLYSTTGFQSMLNKIDSKYFAQKYSNDPRFPARREAKLKEINASADKLSNFKLYKATNINDYLVKSNELTNVYRELASIDAAYEKIYNKSDINYMYENNISGTAKMGHILITANPTANDVDSSRALNEARNKALEVIEKVRKGQSFGQAMTENNKGNNKAGYLGEYNVDTAKKAQLNEKVIDAAFKLKNKEVSEPIETEHGFEIVYVEYTKEKPTFEAAKSEIAQKMWTIYSNQNPYFQAYALIKARELAGLEINDEMFKSQYANTILKAKASYVQYDPNATQPGLS